MKLYANVAQLVEQLIRNQQVKGSSPFISSLFMRVWRILKNDKNSNF